MKLPILASFIIFLSVVHGAIKHQTKSSKEKDQEFWEKELRANTIRRKSLDDLNYISIPLENLPLSVLTEREDIREYQELLRHLSTAKIVNFTGITNTDLKLTYGTANITVLTEYDQNFTNLVTTLQKWAEILHSENYIAEAKQVLEYAISIQSDNGKSYSLLASIYDKEGNKEGILSLEKNAHELLSSNGKTICRILRKSYPYIDWPHYE